MITTNEDAGIPSRMEDWDAEYEQRTGRKPPDWCDSQRYPGWKIVYHGGQPFWRKIGETA